ncbi:tetratricopeptide repeat protein [Streptomyces sp. NEAU-NA10]|uniref:tetratricopeptide repeat protein n=1 Tax=Streptomyces sp. NEAU-NA10 TaxID=3416050 RepID=UPI003CC5D5BD
MSDGDYFDFRDGVFLGPVTGAARGAPWGGAVSNLLGAPAVFTGRDQESDQLLGVLDPGGGGHVAVSSLAGLGGVGKTALALHVAHTARQRGWFPGGALFVDMRGYDEVPATADHAVLSLLRTLAGPGQLDTGDDLYGRYRAELARREPVLIVLDNVCDPAQVTPLLPGEGTGHRVLITSRDVQDSLPVRQFTIGALEPEDACLLVDRSLRQHDPGDRRATDEPDAVRELAELCGHLPLALLIAAALLRRRRPRPVTTLTAELRAAADRVRTLRFGDLAVRPVFDVMYRRLEPEAARVLRALAHAPTPDVWVGSAVALTGMGQEELSPLLEDLVAASLLTTAPGGAYWRMHDLVQLYVRNVSAEDPGTAREADGARERLMSFSGLAVLSAVEHLRPHAPDTGPDLFEGNYQHALSWLDLERQTLIGLTQWTDTDPPGLAEKAMTLALALQPYLQLRRSFDDWLKVVVAALRTAQRLGDHGATAAAGQSLAVCLNGLGRGEEAVGLLRLAQRAFAVLGKQNAEGRCWGDLGAVLHSLGRYAEALDAQEQSLRLFGALGDRRRAAMTLTNRGATLGALGRLDEAHEAVTQALGIHVDAGDKPAEAPTRGILGTLRMTAGRAEEAADEYRHAARLYGDLGDWHGAAASCLSLGHVLRSLGRDEEAAEAFEAAAEVYHHAGAASEAAEARHEAESPGHGSGR